MSDLPNWKTIPAADRDQLLRDFCAKGLSAAKIAGKFAEASRSAVIGRAYRLKLHLNGSAERKGKTGRPKKDASPRAKVAKPKAKKQSPRVAEATSWRGANNPHHADIKARAEQRAASPGLPAHLVAGEASKPIETSDVGVPAPRNLKLVELTERTCKWAHGDPAADDFGFCGNDAPGTGPYCRYHSRLAYEPTTVRQRASLRSAERIS
ncbi:MULTISPECIES: GcrA family cell cycle regulator [unclassified Mesorhizobium]|uniref:GcrA family cell cycle regulator n=1 Tax=unclassified Mesorhizobium TaxID=325217 RepID=UPI000FCA455E|nr:MULTISPECIES: GcrA family cell cycle regulator [unclassified Mesorhizobium]RUV17870.1 GcrA cell cycle regulator [Mesorhizobium sp. M1A.F.Ca.IN.022.04.1.1]RWG27102.1 MAG: GcrA cell cycle regulator [Mesorhizobium sp.]